MYTSFWEYLIIFGIRRVICAGIRVRAPAYDMPTQCCGLSGGGDGGAGAFSVGEDGSALVWGPSGAHAGPLQSLDHPASLWCCTAVELSAATVGATDAGGSDLATGSHDGNLRVFTRVDARFAGARVRVLFVYLNLGIIISTILSFSMTPTSFVFYFK
jgi:hypothetical protein